MTIRGASWASSWTIPHIKQDVGAELFYNSQTWRMADHWQKGGVPIVRTTQQGGNYSWQVALPQLMQNNYIGPVILFNEPDLQRQDNAHLDSVVTQYYDACNLVANYDIWFVAGNYIFQHQRSSGAAGNWKRTGSSEAFALQANLRPQDVLGIHLYRNAESYMRKPDDIIDEIVGVTGVSRLWVTEYGLDNYWSVAQCKLYVTAIENHPAVEAAFFYTADVAANREGGQFGVYVNRQRELTNSGVPLS